MAKQPRIRDTIVELTSALDEKQPDEKLDEIFDPISIGIAGAAIGGAGLLALAKRLMTRKGVDELDVLARKNLKHALDAIQNDMLSVARKLKGVNVNSPVTQVRREIAGAVGALSLALNDVQLRLAAIEGVIDEPSGGIRVGYSGGAVAPAGGDEAPQGPGRPRGSYSGIGQDRASARRAAILGGGA